MLAYLPAERITVQYRWMVVDDRQLERLPMMYRTAKNGDCRACIVCRSGVDSP